MSNGQGQPDIGKVYYEVARISMFLLAQCSRGRDFSCLEICQLRKKSRKVDHLCATIHTVLQLQVSNCRLYLWMLTCDRHRSTVYRFAPWSSLKAGDIAIVLVITWPLIAPRITSVWDVHGQSRSGSDLWHVNSDAGRFWALGQVKIVQPALDGDAGPW